MVEAFNGSLPAGSAAGDRRQWIAEVVVEPKPGVNDPQGEAVLGGLRSLGYAGVSGVRSGRFFRVSVTASDERAAEASVGEMCERLLANPVIETYAVTIVEDAAQVRLRGVAGVEDEGV